MLTFNKNSIHLGESCWIKITSILSHNQQHQRLSNSFMEKDIT